MQNYSQEQLEKARQFIDDLRNENGGITKDDREFLERKRPGVLKSFDNIRRKLGASTQILAEQLYQKSTRFVYELIQNAEDNKYTITTQSPHLSFTLQSDRIIIDSNEDGFTQKDIKAICSIGESTKTSIQGYIGEKGIGFKSVFNVAHKVHIQSGPYSFAFEYRKGDSIDRGLGMVTPLSERLYELPSDVRTRTILYLHEDEDREAMCQDLIKLPDTLLLFLKNLQQLTVRFELPDQVIQKVQYSLTRPEKSHFNNKVQIKAAITGTDSIDTSNKSFWVKKHRAFNLPPDPARQHIHEAEVVLAFPIDEDDVPVIGNQDVYAFLPLRKVGYKVIQAHQLLLVYVEANLDCQFLIQSDFVTKASREDVVVSAWNKRLLEEVVVAFRNAISGPNGFLEHDTLRYSWIRYIPRDIIADEFWGLLQARLYNELCISKFFYSMDGSCWKPNQLRILLDFFRDEYSNPLLADLAAGETAYVSESYNVAIDIPISQQMKATHLGYSGFLERLEQDLNLNLDPRMKTKPSNSPWHVKVATILILIARKNDQKLNVQRLKIVPLDNGRWICPLNASIFFPTSDGIDILKGLPLNLVDKEALENSSRKELFSQLGVTECSPRQIFPLIELRYKLPSFMSDSASDVKFLFWHHEKLPTSNYSIFMWFWDGEDYVLSDIQEGGWIYCSKSNHAYATVKIIGLLKLVAFGTKSLELSGFGHLGLKRRRNYEGGVISKSRDVGRTQAEWPQYNKSEQWDSFIREQEVGILSSANMMQLKDTYLPLPKLKAIASNLGLAEGFGFVQELNGITDAEANTWGFLKRFGVGVDEDVSFWLRLLKQVREKSSTTISIIERYRLRKKGLSVPNVVFEIYRRLQKYDDESEIIEIRKAFESGLIFIPSYEDVHGGKWISISLCVWNAPVWFDHLPRLESIKEYQKLQPLFVNTLEVSNAKLSHFMVYLSCIKELESHNPQEEAKIPLLYEKFKELTKEGARLIETENIRSWIENNKLLYYRPYKSWHAPSSCIWATDEIQLPGKISIAAEYKKQSVFVRKVLGIKEPSLEMHILALQKRALENPTKEGILNELKNICALNPADGILRDKLSTCKFLPVCETSQMTEWMDVTSNFAIIDRKEYGDIFKNKINILDFSLEEAHSINAILVSLGLEGRYMSKSVKEETKIADGLLNDALTKNLRRKAYAICRYAAHYGIKDAISAYRLLQTLELFTSDSITKEVSITQNKNITSIKVDTALLHIAQDDSKLKIYIPKEQRQREVCLSRQLPIELLKHLGVSNFRKGAELGPIITSNSFFAIDAILDSDGIIDVPGISPPKDYNESESLTLDVSQDVVSPAINADMGRSAESREDSKHSGHDGFFVDEHFNRVESMDSSLPFRATSGSRLHKSSPERPDLYKELLDVVVKQASKTRGIPVAGDVIIAPICAGFSVNTSLAINSSEPGEGLYKIGAAGELFMFEVLKILNLPLFNLENWRSSIRHRVTIHDDYKDMPYWSGLETSDIVYEDHGRKLTELLVANNYFDHVEKSDEKSEVKQLTTYYIEVKTTPGPLTAPFYCSQNQFDKMESMRLQAEQPLKEVYLIARVFNLGASGMGYKLYVDPAGLRRKGQLRFAADKYVVTS
ncbi:hypothetical protein BELL_0517g00020 [Botrytis elliptica]|uniref:Sacsin/Nov domain-containing protein n=1 Tax=Botrytis elliptica TaxID=278938 RepID=A0A4Z1JDX7_9HELO|nr:hypothetical protein BELL_0517g00020 [Botrytis elliptica]